MIELDQSRQRIEAVVTQVLEGDPGDKTISSLWQKLLTIPGMREYSIATFRKQEYELEVGTYPWLEENAAVLQRLTELGLTCTPEFVSLLPLDEGRAQGLLITRWAAFPGQEVYGVVEHTKFPIPSAGCDLVRQDLRTLARHGLILEGLEGEPMWQLALPSQTLLLQVGDCLEEGFGDDDFEEMFERAEEMFYRLT